MAKKNIELNRKCQEYESMIRKLKKELEEVRAAHKRVVCNAK